MLYPVLQILSSLLKLGFGGVALAIARRLPVGGCNSTGWMLVGVGCGIGGVVSTAQTVWALRAVVAGAGAPVYQAYLRWAPAMNYSRHAMMLALAGLLCALPWLARQAGRRPRAVAVGVIALAGAVGAGLGVLEGEFARSRHYTATAVLDVVEMLLFFGMLLAALQHGWLDRWLWGLLALYASRQALNVISFSALSWRGVAGVWVPSTAHLIWTAVGLWAVMLALALYRLRLARRGAGVSGLLDAPGGTERSATGVLG